MRQCSRSARRGAYWQGDSSGQQEQIRSAGFAINAADAGPDQRGGKSDPVTTGTNPRAVSQVDPMRASGHGNRQGEIWLAGPGRVSVTRELFSAPRHSASWMGTAARRVNRPLRTCVRDLRPARGSKRPGRRVGALADHGRATRGDAVRCGGADGRGIHGGGPRRQAARSPGGQPVGRTDPPLAADDRGHDGDPEGPAP